MKRICWILAALAVIAGGANAQQPGSVPVISGSAESSHVISSAPGFLVDAYVTPQSTAGFLMLFNATSAPADGAVTPQDCIAIQASVTQSVFTINTPPEWFSTGITAVFSTTGCFTKTASATAFFHARVLR